MNMQLVVNSEPKIQCINILLVITATVFDTCIKTEAHIIRTHLPKLEHIWLWQNHLWMNPSYFASSLKLTSDGSVDNSSDNLVD